MKQQTMHIMRRGLEFRWTPKINFQMSDSAAMRLIRTVATANGTAIRLQESSSNRMYVVMRTSMSTRNTENVVQ